MCDNNLTIYKYNVLYVYGSENRYGSFRVDLDAWNEGRATDKVY